MSEAPRVQLTSTDLSDLDPSISYNQQQQQQQQQQFGQAYGQPQQQQQYGQAYGQPQQYDQTHNQSYDQSYDPSYKKQSLGQNGSASNGNLEQSNEALQNAGQHAQKAGSNIYAATQNALNAAVNHPAVQNARETVMNGPVAQNIQAEGAKTRNEFADLANSRQIPDHKTATGQNLTHYHSMFYRLLSWKNPRATGIAFAVTVISIFAARYLNLIRYILKAVYIILGATASAELVGQLALGKGLTSQVRPRQYFVIPKASLERLLDDVEQLINFFVIESQRIVFAENVYATIAAFVASLTSYFLIKLVPLWGLALIATTITYLGPLIYIQNKEMIDAQLEKGYNVANQQARQIKEVASKNAVNAAQSVQGLTNQYTAKASETINQYRGRANSSEAKKAEFPVAPRHEPLVTGHEPIVAQPIIPVGQPIIPATQPIIPAAQPYAQSYAQPAM